MSYVMLKGIIWEDMVNYKKISTTLMFPTCDFKCGDFCQNSGLAAARSEKYDIDEILDAFKNNPITEAIVLQGLEPFDTLWDVYTVAASLKEHNLLCDLVIYTGYNRKEIDPFTIQALTKYTPGNLIIKWGRYIPNQTPHYDEVLGVNLASDNQYAEVIKK